MHQHWRSHCYNQLRLLEIDHSVASLCKLIKQNTAKSYPTNDIRFAIIVPEKSGKTCRCYVEYTR